MKHSHLIASAKVQANTLTNSIGNHRLICSLSSCRSTFFQRNEAKKEGRKSLIQRNAILAFNLGGSVVGFKKADSAAFSNATPRLELRDYLYLLAAGVVVLSQAFFVNKF